MLKKYIEKIVSGIDLSSLEMEEVMEIFLTGSLISPIQTGAFLGALQSKGVSPSELAGGVEAMKRHSVHFTDEIPNAMDIVGTGGDGGRSFNISTAAALIAAGAGLNIAKHGGRASSGKCGSADVLEALGIDLSISTELMIHSLCKNGIGFFFAPAIHPLMSKMAPIRKQLGIRSFFNLLGPLGNPVPIRTILLGTANPNQLDLFSDTLIHLNYKRGAVVSSSDHLDEISCFAPTKMIEINHGSKICSTIWPEEFFEKKELDGSLCGEDPIFNAKLIRGILESKIQGAPRAVSLLNAGTALYIANRANSIREGIRMAGYSINSGSALRKLELLTKIGQTDNNKASRNENW